MSPLEQQLYDALEEAKRLITSEYCSHKGGCTAANQYCYAQQQIAAMDEFERQVELETPKANY